MRFAALSAVGLSAIQIGCISASLSGVPEFGGLGRDGCSPVLARLADPAPPSAPSLSRAQVPCPEPAELRLRAQKWLSEGRLDRTVRVLLGVKARCPTSFGGAAEILESARSALESLREDPLTLQSRANEAYHAGEDASARAYRDAFLLSAEAEQRASAIVERAGIGANSTSRSARALSTNGGDDAVRMLQFSNDGGALIAAGQERLTAVWSLVSGKLQGAILPTEEAGIFQPFVLAISPDGELVANRHGESVELWSTRDGSLARSLSGHQKDSQYSEELDSVAFSDDARYVATGDELGAVRIWRAADGKLLSTMEAQESRLVGLTWSPDGRMVATASRNEPAVRVRDVRSGETRLVLRTDQDELYHLRWSADGRVIVAADMFHEVRAWDLETCQSAVMVDWPPCHVYEDGSCGGLAIFGLALSPRGDHIYGVFNGDGVAVWDAATGRRSAFLRLPALDPGWGAAISRDGRLFAVGTRSGVHLFRTDAGGLVPLVSMSLTDSGRGEDGYVLDTARRGAPIAGSSTAEQAWPRPTGYYDAFGWGSSALQCRIGKYVVPVEMCAERLRVKGLLAKRAAGVSIEPEDTGED